MAGIAPDEDMILLNVGQGLMDAKEIDKAIGLYKIYTTDFPNIVVAWNELGDAYLLKENKEEAKKCYEQALKIRPANQRARESLARLSKQ